jgi:hypothetical protein
MFGWAWYSGKAMRESSKKISETRATYAAESGRRRLVRNPMRNIRTAAKMIVRAHERAFKELEKF